MVDYKEYWRQESTCKGTNYYKQSIRVEAYARGEVFVESVEESLTGDLRMRDVCLICLDSVEDVDAVLKMLTEARAVMVGCKKDAVADRG